MAIPPTTTVKPVDAIEQQTLRHHGLLGSGGNSHAILAIDYDQLPLEARQTMNLIISGGPFPYPQDGTPFGNRFQDLPSTGAYLEFTVRTPGVSNRGARRLVVRKRPTIVFFTACHYERVSAQGGSPADRQAAMLNAAQALDPLWRNGFYIVTGMSADLRHRIETAIRRDYA